MRLAVDLALVAMRRAAPPVAANQLATQIAAGRGGGGGCSGAEAFVPSPEDLVRAAARLLLRARLPAAEAFLARSLVESPELACPARYTLLFLACCVLG